MNIRPFVVFVCWTTIVVAAAGWGGYRDGKHAADRWWHVNPMQSRCVVTQPEGIVIWGDCKLECLNRVFTKNQKGEVTAQCFCDKKAAPVAWSEITSADGVNGVIVGTGKPGKPIEWHTPDTDSSTSVTSGDCSPAVQGNTNKVEIHCDAEKK